MKRLQDNFLDILDEKILLKEKTLLEIGCGDGNRSIEIAKKCKHLIALDPDHNVIQKAQQINAATNLSYHIGRAEELAFKDKTFDVVIFTLSLHHVPLTKMKIALQEAVRVTKKNGFLIFLEPAYMGTLFEAEILFDAGDGDERKQKAYAYYTMLNTKHLLDEMHEIYDETVLQFDSYEKFIDEMKPKKNLEKLKRFLEENNSTLTAQRRINIFKVKKTD